MTKKLYLFYFMYGVINSIAIQMLPLVMTQKGFDPSQVTIILSCVFLAALFQPLIGLLTRQRFGSKRMLQMMLIGLLVTAVLIVANQVFTLMAGLVLLFSVARGSISPIYDSYATMASRDYQVNYGLVRSGASLGFGIGMAIYTLVANILGLEYNASFGMVAFIAILGLVIFNTLPTERTTTNSEVAETAKTNLLMVSLLILMYILYYGGLNIRISYMSTYYVEFGYTTTFISLATFFLVIPEIIFLPLYNRLFSKYNKVLLMAIAIFLGIIQMILYIAFPTKPIILLIACLFNGFQIMIFFPTYFGLLQDSLGPKNSAFGFIINMTLQSLFVGIFNLVAIRPVVIATGSTIPIFMMIIGLQLLAFGPLFIYKLKFSRKLLVYMK